MTNIFESAIQKFYFWYLKIIFIRVWYSSEQSNLEWFSHCDETIETCSDYPEDNDKKCLTYKEYYYCQNTLISNYFWIVLII